MIVFFSAKATIATANEEHVDARSVSFKEICCINDVDDELRHRRTDDIHEKNQNKSKRKIFLKFKDNGSWKCSASLITFLVLDSVNAWCIDSRMSPKAIKCSQKLCKYKQVKSIANCWVSEAKYLHILSTSSRLSMLDECLINKIFVAQLDSVDSRKSCKIRVKDRSNNEANR